jgi:hypothetical protein
MRKIRLRGNILILTISALWPILFYGCKNSDIRNPINLDSNISNLKTGEFAKRERYALGFLKTERLLPLNDTAKWYMYNIFCDVTAPDRYSHNRKIYLSSLDLYTFHADWNSDSTLFNINCMFVLDDSILMSQFPTNYGLMPAGITFNGKTMTVLGLYKGFGGYISESGPKARLNNLLQPEVLEFVKNHKDSLNRWYLDALKRHGVEL